MPQKHQLPNPTWGLPWKFLDSTKGPKNNQNRTKNGTDFKTIFKSEKMALQQALGALLGRSWAHLKVHVGHFLVEIVEPVKNPHFRQHVVPRHVLDPTWPPKVPKMTPRRPPRRAKIDQKSMSKNDQNLDRCSRPAFRRFGAARRNAVASWGDYRGV